MTADGGEEPASHPMTGKHVLKSTASFDAVRVANEPYSLHNPIHIQSVLGKA
jgi:hypothetical protein